MARDKPLAFELKIEKMAELTEQQLRRLRQLSTSESHQGMAHTVPKILFQIFIQGPGFWEQYKLDICTMLTLA